MEVLVFVEPAAGGYRAVPLSSAELAGTGRSEAEALGNLIVRLRAGRLVRVELPTPHPPPRERWEQQTQAALDNLASTPPAVWNEFLECVAEARRQSEAEELERERLADQAEATSVAPNGPLVAADTINPVGRT